MKVLFIFRKLNVKFQSIEELFKQIIVSLSEKVHCEAYSVNYYSIGLKNRIRILLDVRKLSSSIFHITGDIHFIALILPRKRTLLTIHDLGTHDKLRGIAKFIFWLFWIYLPVKRLRYITVISEATKRHLLSLVSINPAKIEVIHNMLIGAFKSVDSAFNKNCPVILQIGITENKNILRLSEALNGIKCKLIILGIPNEDQKKTLRLNNVNFEIRHGLSRTQVIDLYESCDLVTFVSTHEGFGLPIIEANATGRAVITSNISAMPEVAGGSALLVNPFSVIDIHNGIIKLINDDLYRKDLIEKGFKNVRRFTPELIAEQYLDLYKKILKN